MSDVRPRVIYAELMDHDPLLRLPSRFTCLSARAMSLLATMGRQLLEFRLEESELRLGHYAVLEVLAQTPGVSSGLISLVSGYDPFEVDGYLDGLHASGYLELVADPADERQLLASLTDDGQELLIWCRAQADAATEEFLAPLDSNARATLERTLTELLAAHDL